MKVLVTGCSGRVGKKVLDFFIKNKIYSYANFNKNKLNNQKKSKFLIPYRKNIIEKKFIIPEDVEALVHIASLTTHQKNISTYKFNIKMNKKIFKAIKKSKNLKKLIFFSSVSIYGNKNIGLINENLNFINNNFYAKSKYNSEKIFNKLKKIKIYNLRIPGILGTKNEKNFISQLIYKMKKNSTIRLFNPKNKFNNVILIDNLNNFILNLLKNNFRSGTILLGSVVPLKLIQLTNMIKNLLRSKSKIIWEKRNEGFYLDISKAKMKYNFNPLKTSDTIKKYIKASL